MTGLAELHLIASGKVREMYDRDDRLLMVASDRISTYDAVHPTEIPDKGKVLTGLSAFWFGRTGGIVENHLVSAREGVPEEARGRALVVRELEMLPVECVVRGYITGSGWKDYQRSGSVCGIELPPGLRESEQLPEPIFTPSTKAASATTRRSTSRRGGAGRRPRADAQRAEVSLASVRLRRRARARAGRDPGGHQVRVWYGRPRRAGARGRGPDTRLLALLARRGI